jgi:hypothetical protein
METPQRAGFTRVGHVVLNEGHINAVEGVLSGVVNFCKVPTVIVEAPWCQKQYIGYVKALNLHISLDYFRIHVSGGSSRAAS